MNTWCSEYTCVCRNAFSDKRQHVTLPRRRQSGAKRISKTQRTELDQFSRVPLPLRSASTNRGRRFYSDLTQGEKKLHVYEYNRSYTTTFEPLHPRPDLHRVLALRPSAKSVGAELTRRARRDRHWDATRDTSNTNQANRKLNQPRFEPGSVSRGLSTTTTHTRSTFPRNKKCF